MEYLLILLWLAAFGVLSVAALGVAEFVFPEYPYLATAFSIPISLLVLATVTHWVGSFIFGPGTILLAVSVLVSLNYFLPASQLTYRYRRYWETMAVFTLAFGFLIAVRAVEPAVDPGGGEKFLDFGLLKTLTRATTLPPMDMWFAGAPVQYYYGGHLIAALLAKLTQTPPRYAYNLALAGFYAMLVTAAYGLASTIAGEQGYSHRLGGGLAAFFTGFASNLRTPGRIFAWLLPDPVSQRLAALFDVKLDVLVQSPFDFGYIDYWNATRVIPGTINEFPFFAFTLGDLHAHMMSTPFLLLVCALAYTYFHASDDNLTRRRILVFGAIPIASGYIAVINTWSFPTTLGIVWLTLIFTNAHPVSLLVPRYRDRDTATAFTDTSRSGHRVGHEVLRVGSALFIVLLIGGIALLWIAPFVNDVLLTTSANAAVHWFPTRSPLTGLLIVHGGFLAVFTLYLLPHLRAVAAQRIELRQASIFGLVGLFILTITPLRLGGTILIGSVLVTGWLLLRWTSRLGFEAVVLVAGAGLLVLVEFVYVDTVGLGRYNTVFKVYMQVWVLWALAAGVALARSIHTARSHSHTIFGRTVSRSAVLSVGTAVLIVSASLYGGLHLQNHFTSTDPLHRVDEPTLDALAFVTTHHPGEAEAIEWLNEQEGRVQIVSAPGNDTFSWTNPAATLTGHPTIVGWAHEKYYRGHSAYATRAAHVKKIFAGPHNKRVKYLKKYDVEYIYVSLNERSFSVTYNYSLYPGISIAFENNKVRIYHVNQSNL